MGKSIWCLAPAILLAACNGNADGAPGAPAGGLFDGISANEIVHYVGTEPFWGGSEGNGVGTYSTPDNPEPREFATRRFAGNNGLSISGQTEIGGFDLMVTPGECSDGMSDRTFPYTATLMIGGEQRQGCAWTDSQPFSEVGTP